jgi:hypothetical protein
MKKLAFAASALGIFAGLGGAGGIIGMLNYKTAKKESVNHV